MTMSKIRVIFINGTSSTGKTTLARNLQKSLSDKWLYMDMDHFIEMINPEIAIFDKNHPKFLEKTSGFYAEKSGDGYHIDVGHLGEKILSDMVEQVKNMLELGWNIIFVGVRPYEKQLKQIKEKLAKFNPLTIYLYASKQIIQNRELGRDNRLTGSTVELLKRFEGKNLHDLQFDSGATKAEIIAKEIVEKYELDNN